MSKFNYLTAKIENRKRTKHAKSGFFAGIALLFCLFSFNAGAQESRYMERGMNIHYFDIPLNSDSAVVEGVKVKAFGTRTQAVSYFRTMTLKRDMINVVVDSVAIMTTKPELITIREKIE